MEDHIKVISNYLRSQPVKRAYLFGSYARGVQDESSDIDLMIELDEQVGLYRFVGIQLKLEELLKKNVDLITVEGISPRLKSYIEKDKLLVYER